MNVAELRQQLIGVPDDYELEIMLPATHYALMFEVRTVLNDSSDNTLCIFASKEKE